MGKRSGPSSKHLPKGLVIIHEDPALLVVDKPPGLLTMGTETEKTQTAYFALTDYVRKGSPRSKDRIFIVHRLDRDASGVLIFAKTREAKYKLQNQWKETKKRYLAVVYGRPEKPSGTMTSYLAENKAHRVYATDDPRKGKLSRTTYRVLKETRDFSLLEVDLLTGRKHQIRVHLADHGHPIVGDTRYGGRNRSHKRMALHALSISITHPISGAPCTFETKVPEYLERLVGGLGQADAQQANSPEARARL